MAGGCGDDVRQASVGVARGRSGIRERERERKLT